MIKKIKKVVDIYISLTYNITCVTGKALACEASNKHRGVAQLG